MAGRGPRPAHLRQRSPRPRALRLATRRRRDNGRRLGPAPCLRRPRPTDALPRYPGPDKTLLRAPPLAGDASELRPSHTPRVITSTRIEPGYNAAMIIDKAIYVDGHRTETPDSL